MLYTRLLIKSVDYTRSALPHILASAPHVLFGCYHMFYEGVPCHVRGVYGTHTACLSFKEL